ncbi:MAG: SDR family NAD(P)-dependent oxidoreductase [Methylococcales bacterium]
MESSKSPNEMASSKKHFSDEPIAITGMGCRFPGGAESPEAFWNLISQGKDGIVDVPRDRWDVDRYYDPDPNKLGKMYVKSGGFLDQRIDQFDALFFGVSPREAACMDPQQRVLLEVAWEAMENAGINPERLRGSETGVFIGGFMLDNNLTQMNVLNRDMIGPHSALGSTMTILSNRLSYVFDFRGPSVSMDTACSSSLVALHYGCQGLLNGDCSVALVGGVNIMHRPENPIAMCKGQFLSPDGRCKSFDSRADGYGRGEGAGIVILKTRSAAIRDGDEIHAIIRGTGVNQDGHSDGITVPNPESQQELMRKVFSEAKVDPRQICYMEAHGTGTPVGDPLEAGSLGAVLGKDRGSENPCAVGSVKANIGHLEAASGIAGVIKLVLSLQHKQIPPLANLKMPNPNIPFEELGLRLPMSLESMPSGSEPALVAINSFGYGGTNAHAILQENTIEKTEISESQELTDADPYLLPLSAKSESAMKELASRYLEKIDAVDSPSLRDLCYSSSVHRGHYDYRLGVIANTMDEVRDQLKDFVDGIDNGSPSLAKALPESTNKPVFVFTGMGPQWWAMGRELLDIYPVFRSEVERCDKIFTNLAGWSILQAMLADKELSNIADTVVAQPANFVLQVGLIALWRSFGVEPAAVIGHSVGEVASAYIAGVLSLEDAIKVSYHRSRVQKKAAGLGGMLAVGLTKKEADKILEDYYGKVSIAAINSQSALTLAGDQPSLSKIAEALEVDGVFNRLLKVEVPYHSPLMEPLKDEIRSSLSGLETREPSIPLYSTVTGRLIETASYDADYWCQNIREPVFFSDTINTMIEAGYRLFVEVGPHPVLSTSIKECLMGRGSQGVVLTSLHCEKQEQSTLMQALANLYAAGYSPDWKRLYPDGGNFISLPNYPWQRESYWNETEKALLDRIGLERVSFLGDSVRSPNPCWENTLNTSTLPFLDDHYVDELRVLPGAAYVEAGLMIHENTINDSVPVLENLDFHNALVIDDSDDPTIYCSFDPESQVYHVHSHSKVSASPWRLHASGRLCRTLSGSPPPVNLEELKASLSEYISSDMHYQRMNARGLDYGPYFQGVRELWLNSDRSNVLAKIEGHKDLVRSKDQYLLHPTLLDACFQTLLTTLDEGDENIYVPVHIDRVHFYSSPEKTFWCLGSIKRCQTGMIEGDLTLCDTNGTVLVDIRGVRAKALTNNTDVLVNAHQWTYQFDWKQAELPDTFEKPERVLLFKDEGETGRQLVDQFNGRGAQEIVTVKAAEAFCCDSSTHYGIRPGHKEDMQQLIANCNGSGFSHIVYLWPLNAKSQQRPITDSTDLVTCLYLIQALTQFQGNNPPRLVVVTQGAQAISATESIASLDQTPLYGLIRVAMNENPELSYRLVDLGPELTASLSQQLVDECLADGGDEEVVLRDSGRFVHRFNRMALSDPNAEIDEDQPTAVSINRPYRLEIDESRDIGSLRFRENVRSKPQSEEVEIEVHAAMLDTIDVLASQHDIITGTGTEIILVGRICRIGDSVGSLKVGDSVVSMTDNLIGSFITKRFETVFSFPALKNFDFEACATIPLDFVTAFHGLFQTARIKRRERIVIHDAASATGLAAIQVARWQGADIYATVNNENQKDYLLALGIKHVWLSDPILSFDSISKLTLGKGVDVVFNSGSVELARKSIALLAPFGRIIVTDKNESVLPSFEMGNVSSNIQIINIDIAGMIIEQPNLFKNLLNQVCNHINASDFTPLPYTSFTSRQVIKAFQYLQDDESPTKVVLNLRSIPAISIYRKIEKTPLFSENASYLITGGFGGFGLSTAAWMVENGARNLVLVGRRGAATDEAKQAVQSIESKGCKVLSLAVDISEEAQVVKLFASIAKSLPPLRGVMHTAAVLDDGPLNYLTKDQFDRVMGPKALGAWNLHQHLSDSTLDFFFLFSSIASQVGSPGQATYVAANTFLDALAQLRNAQGLTATSIQWGALGDVGMAARHEEVKQYFARVGINSLSPKQAVSMLGRLLPKLPEQIAIADMNWEKWGEFNPVWAGSPRFSHLVSEHADLEPAVSTNKYIQQILAATADAKPKVVTDLIAEEVARILRLPIDKVEIDQSLANMGVDSLLAMELQTAIKQNFGVNISTLELMKGNTLAQIGTQIQEKIPISIGSSKSTADALLLPEETEVENKAIQPDDVDALSDDEVTTLLNALLSKEEVPQ